MTTPALILKQYDTYPPLQAVLSDNNGPIGLASATTVYMVLKGNTNHAIIYGSCTVASAAGGFVQYAWGPSDTVLPDTYTGEFQINWAAGGIQKVPNEASNNFTVEIDTSIDGSIA